ncbi:hypothetical protein J6590_084386 [Homalodisca vitripennis]|nr:hypothetical protein J6590_084386 [Homalodisca vitripennis]
MAHSCLAPVTRPLTPDTVSALSALTYSNIASCSTCRLWFHLGCVNISDRQLKKMTPADINSWTCNNCKATMDQFPRPDHYNLNSSLSNPNPNNQMLACPISFNSSDTIQELQNSLIENNCLENSDSQEDKKKEMAAKIGSALVEENKFLKEETLKLKTKVSIMEEKLEEMENLEKAHIDKIESLLQLNTDIEGQLIKEKKLYLEAQTIYEENDSKLGLLIDGYVKKIAELEKTVSMLKRKTENQASKTSILKHTTTQTSSSSQDNHETRDSSIFFKVEISDIKTKLERMEIAINTLTSRSSLTFSEKLENTLTLPMTETIQALTSGTSQTCKQKLQTTLTDCNLSLTSGTSQTCKQKLQTTLTDCNPPPTSGTSQTCKQKLQTTLTDATYPRLQEPAKPANKNCKPL